MITFNSKCLLIFLSGFCWGTYTHAQRYTSSSIFAHNDYEKPVPFYHAYNLEVGFIEADIFLKDGHLFVAHTRGEIKKERTLDSLYLIPLRKQVISNKGYVYANKEKQLTLMIDLKTAGAITLDALVEKLQFYPQLLSCSTLTIAVSGNVPDPFSWKNYPDFIHFDGRPGIAYTTDQLHRITLISSSFKVYSSWKGSGAMPEADQQKLAAVIDEVHAKGKKVRFWSTPDLHQSWLALMQLKADVINTDDVTGLAKFIDMREHSTK